MANTTEAENLTPPEDLESAVAQAEAEPSAEPPAPDGETGGPEQDASAAPAEAGEEAPASPEGEAGVDLQQEPAAEQAGDAASEEARPEEESSELLKPLPGAVTGPEVMTRSRYALVVLAAKRAKQLREGARRLGSTTATNYLTAALEEAAEGVIGYRLADEESPAANDD
jgi:DNA-directed RNA polymerase omega subunit